LHFGNPNSATVQKEMNLEAEYQLALTTPSDIFLHLPALRALADEVGHVTEMGTRLAVSTRAFLASKAKTIRAYDLGIHAGVEELFVQARSEGKDATITQANVLEIEIELTDLLFIDTLHTYDQCLAELNRHAKRVNRYLVFHDTESFGCSPEIPGGANNGILPAIIHYLIGDPNWRFVAHYTNCNGLTVLQRTQPLYTV